MDYVPMPNLDSCPHCGSWAKIRRNKKSSTYFIECPQCHVKTKESKDLHMCNILWNDGDILMPIEEK